MQVIHNNDEELDVAVLMTIDQAQSLMELLKSWTPTQASLDLYNALKQYLEENK